VETSTGLGRWLAPLEAWETFRAHGMLPDEEYHRRYEALLAGIPERVYRTVMLARWLARRYPDAFYTRLTLPGDLDDVVVRFAVESLGAVIRI
jgi:hypothetical protein